MLQKQFYFFAGLVKKTVNHYLDFYCVFQESNDRKPADEIFQTRDGMHLPVFNSYRYSIKTGRNYNSSLAATRRTGISTFRIDT